MEPTDLSTRHRLRPLQFPATIFLIFCTLAFYPLAQNGLSLLHFRHGLYWHFARCGDRPLRNAAAQEKACRAPSGAVSVRSLHGRFSGLVALQNMQLEGLFLFPGIFSGAIIHYSIARVFGPLIFGRGFCGWACWTAMVIDLLPYDRCKGWIPGSRERLQHRPQQIHV